LGVFPILSALAASTQTLGATGNIIEAGGFRYEVVTSGEDITTAGGVKLRALKSGGRYFASAFGFVAGLSLSAANAALQIAFDALATGDTLVIDVDGTVDLSDVTLSTGGVELVLPEGAHLRQSNTALNAHAIKVTADDVSLIGPGKISSHITGLADYFTTGSGIARSVIHWTGDRPYVDGVEIATPSRCGIFLDACESPTTLNCRGDGGYLLADYNPATTLNLYAFYYSPSGQDADAGNVWKSGGNRFSRYMSPEASGPLSGAGTYAPDMNNSYHENCWDHGYYVLATKGGKIRGHRAFDTRLPLAAMLDGTVYEGAQHTWAVTSGLNAEAGISVRGIRNGGAVRNLTLTGGLGGYIDFRPPAAYGDIEPVVEGFRSRPTGVSATLVESIRADNFVLGAAPTANVLRPRLTGLDVVSLATGATPVVRVRGASGFVIPDAEISGKIQHTGSTSVLSLDFCDDPEISDLIFDRSGYDAPSAITLDSVLLANCNRPRVYRPIAVYTSGGANVTARGVNIAATVNDAAIIGGENRMTSVSLVSAQLIVNSGVRTYRSANWYSTNAVLADKVTFPSGTASVIVTNPNVRVGSRILCFPANAGAAQQASNFAAHGGVYAAEEAASGRFRLVTGTGAATVIAGDWFWWIDG